MSPKTRRSTRLGLERLGSRILPAVNAFIEDGTLMIVGDNQPDNVTVSNGDALGFFFTNVNDSSGGRYWQFKNYEFSRIEFLGNGGNDRLNNDTSHRATFNGGLGNDTLLGGPGTDLFLGSPGTDLFFGDAGQDVLYRNGYRGYFSDQNDTDFDLTVGEVPLTPSRRFSAAELAARGGLTVSLAGDRLLLNGPSGAAIALRSSWVKNGNAFETAGAVTLETTGSDPVIVPAVSGAMTRVELFNSPVDDAGNFKGITWAGLAVGSSGNSLNGVFDEVAAP
ncbi:MAG: hypothetical protein ACRC33_15725, partial [Gemmataceae bacterium]